MEQDDSPRPEFFSKKFLAILLTISILTNIVLIVKLRFPDFANDLQAALLPAPKVFSTDHVRGDPNARYTVIEYADFQCPFCGQFHEAMKTVTKEANVRWVFRHFPLKSHPVAEKAAEADECAGDQGKFWEFTDALYAVKGRMTGDSLYLAAKDLGLDGVAFGICLNTGKHAATVDAQRVDGQNKKIQGTPTFYLNGKRFNGFVPLEELERLMGVKKDK